MSFLSLGERFGTPSGPGILLPLWLLAAYVFVASPFFVFFQLAETTRQINAQAVVTLEKALADNIEQNRISQVLRYRVQNLLEESAVPFNYITVRNADRVVLISRGRMGGQSEEKAGATQRKFRATLYRLFSSDRQVGLDRGNVSVGSVDYGISLRGVVGQALPRAFWPLGLGLLAFALLFYLSPKLVIALAERMQKDRRRPVRHAGRAVSRKLGPSVKVATGEAMSSRGLAALGDQLRIGMVTIDSGGKILDGNVSAARCLATEVRRLPGMDAIDALTLFDRDGRGIESPLSQCLANPGQRVQARGWLRRRDRTPFGIELYAVSGRLPVTGACLALIFDRDSSLSSLLAMEDRAGLAETLMRIADEPIAVVNARGRLVMANSVWSKKFGYSREALKDMPLAKLLGAPFEPRDLAERVHVAGAGLHRSGKVFDVSVSVADCDWNHKKGHIIRLGLEPATKVVAEPAPDDDLPGLSFASHDALTGLASRSVMMRTLQSEVMQAEPASPALLLLIVDIRNFRQVNAERGREAGDAAVAGVAALLEVAAPNALNVVRLGGDEFAILLRQPEDDELRAYLARIAAQIRKRLQNELHVEGAQLMLDVDIGASAMPQDAASSEELLAHAETALYAAKLANDGKPGLFAEDMRSSHGIASVAKTLQVALESNQVSLLMRTIESSQKPGKIAAALASPDWSGCPDGPLSGEALWQHAENAGMGAELGAWCMTRIVRALADWESLELDPLPVIIRMPSVVATSGAFRRAWDLARTRHNISPEVMLLWFAKGDSPAQEDIPSGLRIASDCDLQNEPAQPAEVHAIAWSDITDNTDDWIENIRRLLERSRDNNARLLVGPVDDHADRQALSALGQIYFYGETLDGGQPIRAFGRRLARQGAAAI